MRAIIKMYDLRIFLSIANVLSISQDLKGLGNKVDNSKIVCVRHRIKLHDLLQVFLLHFCFLL